MFLQLFIYQINLAIFTPQHTLILTRDEMNPDIKKQSKKNIFELCEYSRIVKTGEQPT